MNTRFEMLQSIKDGQLDWLRMKFSKNIELNGACWNWNGAVNPNGYGQSNIKSRSQLAHRLAYRLWCGMPIAGMELDHKCRNRLCVNPAHLEQVSGRENLLRGIGAPAQNARKTHCKRGHEFSIRKSGRYAGTRYCKQCYRQAQLKWLERGEH